MAHPKKKPPVTLDTGGLKDEDKGRRKEKRAKMRESEEGQKNTLNHALNEANSFHLQYLLVLLSFLPMLEQIHF